MTRTFHDPECGAILSRPLAETESAARAAFSACSGDCAQGRQCQCAAINSCEECAATADDDKAAEHDFAVFRGLKYALLIVAGCALAGCLGGAIYDWLRSL